MNMFLHGIEEFSVVRGNTLTNPAFLENDELKTFNVILANPPYSIKAWDRKAFESDPYGRNLWGTPPQAAPIMRFSSISIRAWIKTKAALLFFGRMAFCFGMRKPLCGAK
jgi:hypothetical protein